MADGRLMNLASNQFHAEPYHAFHTTLGSVDTLIIRQKVRTIRSTTFVEEKTSKTLSCG